MSSCKFPHAVDWWMVLIPSPVDVGVNRVLIHTHSKELEFFFPVFHIFMTSDECNILKSHRPYVA